MTERRECRSRTRGDFALSETPGKVFLRKAVGFHSHADFEIIFMTDFHVVNMRIKDGLLQKFSQRFL